MSDNLRENRPVDASRINITKPYEVNWWINELTITKKQLEDAVIAVGGSVLAVKRHLAKNIKGTV